MSTTTRTADAVAGFRLGRRTVAQGPTLVDRMTAALNRPRLIAPSMPYVIEVDGFGVKVTDSEVPGQRHVTLFRSVDQLDDLGWIAGGSFSDQCDDRTAAHLLIEAF